MRKTLICFFVQLLIGTPVLAQHNLKQSSNKPLNPLLYSSFKNKKTAQVNPFLQEYIRPTKHELMYWPNFPLTAEQIATRDRTYEQSLGQQIVGDIISTGINTLIYGRKTPPAKVPKF